MSIYYSLDADSARIMMPMGVDPWMWTRLPGATYVSHDENDAASAVLPYANSVATTDLGVGTVLRTITIPTGRAFELLWFQVTTIQPSLIKFASGTNVTTVAGPTTTIIGEIDYFHIPVYSATGQNEDWNGGLRIENTSGANMYFVVYVPLLWGGVDMQAAGEIWSHNLIYRLTTL